MTLKTFKLLKKTFSLKKLKDWLGVYTVSLLLFSIVITLIILGVRRLGALQALELIAYDWMVNLHDRNERDSRLLVVEITDRDIEKQQNYPITDDVIARVLANLQQHQPKVIGFDLYREVAYPPGTNALRQQLQRDNVVVIKLIGNGDNSLPAPPGVASKQIGFNDIVIDLADDVLRRNLMYVRYWQDNEIKEQYSFALRTSLKYLEDKNLNFKVYDDRLQIGDAIFPDLQADAGGYQLPASETAGKQILIDYRSAEIAPKVTLSEVLAGNVPPELIKDKIVLIGTTAPSIKDIYPTPYKGAKGSMSGVMVHAQMISQILNVVLDEASLWWFWSEWFEGCWIWGWSLLGAMIAWKLKYPLTIIGVGTLGLGSLWGMCSLAFIHGGWIPLVPPAITLGTTIAGVMGYKALYNLFYDSLTGLPNRSLFAKRIGKLKRKRSKSVGYVAVLCLDLDRFKLIDDGLGYQAGDRILIATAKRLQENTSSKAILARVGADEFAIAVKTSQDTSEAIKIAKQLENILTIPFRVSEQDIFTSASIGLAFNRLDEDFHPQDLIQASYTAMYRAKVSGKNRHQVYATKMHQQARERLQLEAELNQAINNREFELYYQPIVCLKTGKINGFEALIRWISPTRGFVSPGAFIPIAEETGAIVPMGKWVLETACQQMQRWCEQLPKAKTVVMSVNLSSRQFAQIDLISQIQEALIVSELNAANLKLEITESMVMDDVENTIILLHQLKELGIKISMDDFGTGFSSFSYLHRFPTDTIKIDRSFVSNMGQGVKNKEIVNTIIILAHKLGMDAIAEGIETESERETIENFGCEYGQGYFFAKPLPEQDASRLLADNLRDSSFSWH